MVWKIKYELVTPYDVFIIGCSWAENVAGPCAGWPSLSLATFSTYTRVGRAGLGAQLVLNAVFRGDASWQSANLARRYHLSAKRG